MWGPLDKEQAPTVTLQCPRLWCLSICSLDPWIQMSNCTGPWLERYITQTKSSKLLGVHRKSVKALHILPRAYSQENGALAQSSQQRSLSLHGCIGSPTVAVQVQMPLSLVAPERGCPIRPAWSQILKVKTPLPSKSWFVRVSKRQDIRKSKSGFHIFWLARVPTHKLL